MEKDHWFRVNVTTRLLNDPIDESDLLIVSDTIVNVQTGTGNRIEAWDRRGTPMYSKGQIRRFIDVGRLTRGR